MLKPPAPRHLTWRSGGDRPELLQRRSVPRSIWGRLQLAGLPGLLRAGATGARALVAAFRRLQRGLEAGGRQLLGALERGVDHLQHLQEVREHKAREWEAKPLLLRDLLGRGGWALLALFAARVVTSMLPFQFYAPEWYVRLGGELINTSPVLITGFVLLLSAAVINQKQELNRQPRTKVVVGLLQAALCVYLLVIPIQLTATVLVVQRADARLAIQWTWVQQQLVTARERKATAEELRQLGEIEDKLREQRTRGQRQIRFNLVRELIRVCASALVLAWALWLPLGTLESEKYPVG